MKDVLRFLLCITIPLILIGLLFSIPMVRHRSRAEKLVWESATAIRDACDLLRSNVVDLQISPVEAQDSRVPAALRELSPVGILVRDQQVQVSFAGGHSHYGVKAYPPGTKGTGSVEIIPRLWWYHD